MAFLTSSPPWYRRGGHSPSGQSDQMVRHAISDIVSSRISQHLSLLIGYHAVSREVLRSVLQLLPIYTCMLLWYWFIALNWDEKCSVSSVLFFRRLDDVVPLSYPFLNNFFLPLQVGSPDSLSGFEDNKRRSKYFLFFSFRCQMLPCRTLNRVMRDQV